jgi:plastocyanin
MKSIGLLLTVFALFLVGCGGGSGSSSSSSAASGAASGGTTGSGSAAGDSTASSSAAGGGGAKSVTIKDYTYKPASLTVPVGTTVKFTNQDSTPHTATSKQSGAFESGSIDTGKSGEITLEKTGTFAYYCVFHPFMKGTITVE